MAKAQVGPADQTANYPPYQTSGYVTTTQFIDALGRPRLTAGFRVVNGQDQTAVADRVEYDAGGRVAKRYDAYPIAPTADPAASTPNNGFSTYAYLLNGSTVLDPLGRVHTLTKTDGTAVTTLYNGFVTTTFNEDNRKSTVTVDDLGRVIRKETYTGDGSGGNPYTLYACADSTCDGAGRVLTTKQNSNSNTTIAIAYDSLGHKVQMTDPDTGVGTTPGTWTYMYDAVGNLIFEDDLVVNQHVQFCYDALNRVSKKFYFTNDTLQMVNCATDAAATTYTYDSTSDGQYAMWTISGRCK